MQSPVQCLQYALIFDVFTLLIQACWVLNYFSRIQFKNEANLQRAVEAVRVCLLQDKELPVKVEAAIALQFFIRRQDKGNYKCHRAVQTADRVSNCNATLV